MKYSEKYKGTNYLEVVDEIILKASPGKCSVCGCETDFIDVCYEAYVRSDECQAVLDDELEYAIMNTIS